MLSLHLRKGYFLQAGPRTINEGNTRLLDDGTIGGTDGLGGPGTEDNATKISVQRHALKDSPLSQSGPGTSLGIAL